jgi:hypothetical protein
LRVHLGLGLKGIFRREKPTETFDQSSDGLYVQGIRPAKGIEDIGTGKAGLGISDIMSELDIGGNGAVFVFAGDRPDIHAYLNSMYLYVCQEKNYIVHAYAFLGFSKVALCNINNLA